MPQVELSTKTLQRLQHIQRPDETLELVIRRILESTIKDDDPNPGTDSDNGTAGRSGSESYRRALRPRPAPVPVSPFPMPVDEEVDMTFENGNRPHDFTFTKVFRVSINGEDVRNPKWNLILREMLIRADRYGYDLSRHLQRLGVIDGKKEDQGYDYLPEIGKSILGCDANTASRTIIEMADEFDFSVTITFGWRDNGKSLHPGKIARLIIGDSS